MFRIIKEKIKFTLRAIHYLMALYLSIFVFKAFYRGKIVEGQISMGSSNGKYCDENISTLFQYLKKHHKKVYYIMDKHSVDRKKVLSIGEVYNRFSFLGNLTVLRSEVIIYDTSYIDLIRCKRKYVDHIKRVNIFHGIHGLKSIDQDNAHNRLKNDHYIIASSNHEKKIKIDWGFPSERIFVTGLPRYDVLYEKAKEIPTDNTIFYMPTWRPWFKRGFMQPSEEEVKIFKESEYLDHILSLAHSQEINQYLKKKGYCLEIYVHKLMHRYMDKLGIQCNLSNIKFLENNINIQHQLLKSKLLITDYSSVFFDFLFLDKPVILYQFDRKKYYDFIPGSYISESEIIEITVSDFEDLFQSIKKRLDCNDFSADPHSKKLAEKYIQFYDNQNCHRVHQMIQDITKNTI